MRYDVCAAVISDLSVDARVWKEARSLAAAGFSVRLVGCAYDISTRNSYQRDGIAVTEVPAGTSTKSPSLSTRLRVVADLSRAVMATDARVFHAHNIHVVPACYLAARARRAAGVVYDAHELYGDPRAGENVAQRTLGWVARQAERFACRRAAFVITTNPSRALALQARHGLREISVLANVPPLVARVEPWNPGFPEDVEVLLYQGGIYATERPFKETIEAVALLDGVHFVIIGFGRERQIARIRQWAEDARVAERVHILPPVQFDRLVATAAAATVGIVPLTAIDLGYYLGDTNKLHEYLMAGLPVIASDVPEVRRVVTEGSPHVGELFETNQPHAIADAYRRVVEDVNSYRARRAEARRISVERYNWEKEERKLVEIYARLLLGEKESARSRMPHGPTRWRLRRTASDEAGRNTNLRSAA